MNNTSALMFSTRRRRVFWMRNKQWIISTLAVIGLIVFMTVLWISQAERLERHNKYQCAVYGYQADCKTPLAPEDRLK